MNNTSENEVSALKEVFGGERHYLCLGDMESFLKKVTAEGFERWEENTQGAGNTRGKGVKRRKCRAFVPFLEHLYKHLCNALDLSDVESKLH